MNQTAVLSPNKKDNPLLSTLHVYAGNNFAAFYKNERRREQLAEKKLAIERARRKGAIQPFPGQSGWPYEDEEEGGGGGTGSGAGSEAGESRGGSAASRYTRRYTL